MANGKIIYPSGESPQITYVFAQNYDFDNQSGYLDTDDNARGFDGTMNHLSGPRKRTFSIRFTRVLKAQLGAFTLAWYAGGKIDFYPDGDDVTPITVKIMAPPAGESQAAFVENAETYSFEVSFEEV